MYDLMTEDEQQIIDSIDYQAPDGESWMDVADRAVDFFSELKGDSSHLIFTHGGVICSLTYDLGLEDMITCGSVVGIVADEEGNPESLEFEWEFPLEEI